jgi:mannose-6-phosphate isomerase-like protein (cupin superfamily)
VEHPEHARIIVTRDDDEGASDYFEHTVRAVVEYDGDGKPLFKGSQVWGTADGIGVVGSGVDSEPVTNPWFPGPGGVRFNLFTFLPSSEGTGDIGRYRGSEPAEGKSTAMSGLAESFDSDRPGWHISDTIDFVHVVSGEVILELDRREVLVREGDLIIMRGGWHSWRNESEHPCTVASVLVGASRDAA